MKATTHRITSAHFDPHTMLAKALAGDYPSAERGSKYRADEIAYWQERVAQSTQSTQESKET